MRPKLRGDTFEFRKPDGRHLTETVRMGGGDPAHALMIGDSINDIKAAQNAGLPSIAVDFGYSHVPVTELGASHILSHYDALTPELVHNLLDT